MNNTTTIRITKEVYNTVKSIAEQQNEKIQDVIEQAVRDYKKKKFFADLNSSYAKLQKEPKAWAQEESERKEWDATLKDGLEDYGD